MLTIMTAWRKSISTEIWTSKIQNRICHAETVFKQMINILCNASLSQNTWKGILKRFFEPILRYGSESHTLKRKQIWFLRRILRVPWISKMTNRERLTKVDEERNLTKSIGKHQSLFIGHVQWEREGWWLLENTTEKINGRKARGRPKEKKNIYSLMWCHN